MIFFRSSRGGCGTMGCLPLLLLAIVISILVFVFSGGHVFFFAV